MLSKARLLKIKGLHCYSPEKSGHADPFIIKAVNQGC